MSADTGKVIPQEQSTSVPATTATAADVAGISDAVESSEEAKPDDKSIVDSKADQAAPVAAAGSKAAEPAVQNDATQVSTSVEDRGVASAINGGSKLNTGAEQVVSDDPAQPAAEPIVDLDVPAPAVESGANGITDKTDTTITEKPTEEAVPGTSEKLTQTALTGKSADESVTKNGIAAASGSTREDVEMSEGPSGAAVTKVEAMVEAPIPASTVRPKRMADDAFDEDENDLGENKAKSDPSVATTITGSIPIPTKKPGRPKKQQQQPQNPRKILTPVGRTLRKTRSQGPVEI
ncbi:hypothetical protein QBC35DRAFT_195263 [Podospora australis]|uniref:Uncharacterized protein n=1 Tax=Podospora australis TaxID=1536484 RepID=A0AAN6WXR9_9PEZI|nr:hypothetical protein QBC35DRAFT_195263 [Podospora australis]